MEHDRRPELCEKGAAMVGVRLWSPQSGVERRGLAVRGADERLVIAPMMRRIEQPMAGGFSASGKIAE